MYKFIVQFVLFIYCGISFTIRYKFILSFTKIKPYKRIYFVYLLIFPLLQYTINQVNLQEWFSLLSVIILWIFFIQFVLKQSFAISLLLSLLMYTLEESVVGIINPFLFYFSQSLTIMEYYFIGFISTTIICLISGCLYFLIIRKINIISVELNKNSLIIFLPILFILLFYHLSWNGLTTTNITGNKIEIISDISFLQEMQVMILSIVAIGCIMLSLIVWQKIIEFFHKEKVTAIWEQLVYAQKNYVEEAKLHLSQTKALRHDFKNHLVIINSLLEKNNIFSAKQYLSKLSEVTDNLSFICETGNMVIDALLCNKLSIAKQSAIQIECEVIIPKNNGIDDFDLSIIFSNALDNAISACQLVEKEKRYLKIHTLLQGNFFMIKIINSINTKKKKVKGSGLGIPNIQAASQKYQGVVSIEKQADFFQLNVLLIISEHYTNISEQTY